jgi:UDP-GlcNAc:undecaprenyl-phosphate GlcNAc-1-phosphate transferase
LLGSCLGFLPWNFSAKRKIFMGDAGALSVGFVLASIALGTRYSDVNPLGVYAPLLILGLPILDTLYVMGLRMGRGHNPFKGSRDHYALRLEALGWSRRRVVAVSALLALMLSCCAWLVTLLPTSQALGVYTAVGVLVFCASVMLSQVPVHKK